MRRLPLVFSLVLVLTTLNPAARAQQTQAQQKQAPQAPTAQKPAMTPEQATDPTDPLFGVGPLPSGQVSLVGGLVDKIDRVRNRVVIKPFGEGSKMSVAFDERTHIFRDGIETTERGVRRGDRVYVDTMLDGSRLFARNIRVVTSLKPVDARGQILSYNAATGAMTVLDELSSVPISFRVTRETAIKAAGADSGTALLPGSLVTVRFSPDPRNRGIAREISVLATPGNVFTFAGKVRHLDLRSGVIVVENQSDNKTYDLEFDPGTVKSDVMVGSDVVVQAEFVGQGYKAKTVTMAGSNQAQKQ